MIQICHILEVKNLVEQNKLTSKHISYRNRKIAQLDISTWYNQVVVKSDFLTKPLVSRCFTIYFVLWIRLNSILGLTTVQRITH